MRPNESLIMEDFKYSKAIIELRHIHSIIIAISPLHFRLRGQAYTFFIHFILALAKINEAMPSLRYLFFNHINLVDCLSVISTFFVFKNPIDNDSEI